MELILNRKWLKENYTIGKLFIEGKLFSDVLEDKVRELHDFNHDGDFMDPEEGKKYGETAIPCGRYQIIVSHSPKLKRRLPLLLNVEGFEGIRIHAGASAKNSEGCILVGKNTKPGRLENGGYYETTLIQLMDKAVLNGEQIWITIKI